jgi:acetyl esterase/lipase
MPLLRNGYAVASVEYRLSGEAVFPAQIHDIKAAVRWLRAHAQEYNLDPKRFGAWGGSAGGHLVALLGTTSDVTALEGAEGNNDTSSSVQAVCDFYGPSNLITADQNKQGDRAVRQLLGFSPSTNQSAAMDASPIKYVSSKSPPFLLVHGDSDQLVPVEQSKDLYKSLLSAGVQAKLIVVPGGEHGLRGFSAQLWPKVVAFFDESLRPNTEQPRR